MKRILIPGCVALFLILASLNTVYAQRPTPNVNCPNDATYVAITDSCVNVEDFANFMLDLMILIGVLVSIYRATAGFFMFITAQGDPQRLQNGREALTQSMVGLVIVVGGYVFIRAFESILPDSWKIVITGS